MRNNSCHSYCLSDGCLLHYKGLDKAPPPTHHPTHDSLGQVLRYGVFPEPSSPKISVNPCTVNTRVEFGPFLWVKIKLISGRLSKANLSFVETDSFIFSFVRKWSPNSLRALTESCLIIILIA